MGYLSIVPRLRSRILPLRFSVAAALAEDIKPLVLATEIHIPRNSSQDLQASQRRVQPLYVMLWQGPPERWKRSSLENLMVMSDDHVLSIEIAEAMTVLI